jgi:hypothetical protein
VQSDALRQLSADAFRFNSLVCSDPLLSPLNQNDQDIMWSLVDYSTISNAIKVTQTYNADFPFAIDASLGSWYDLFGSNEMDLGGSDALQAQISLTANMRLSNEASNNPMLNNDSSLCDPTL